MERKGRYGVGGGDLSAAGFWGFHQPAIPRYDTPWRPHGELLRAWTRGGEDRGGQRSRDEQWIYLGKVRKNIAVSCVDTSFSGKPFRVYCGHLLGVARTTHPYFP